MLLLRFRNVPAPIAMASQPPRLTIALLGSPMVERDGMPIAVDTRKAIALLAYLAVTGQQHTRDTLATLLWPEYDQDSGRASLRRTLSALKTGLREPTHGAWLRIDRERVGLTRAPDVWIDVDALKEWLADVDGHGHTSTEACPRCVRPLEQAVHLYRGDFLAGFTMRESASFDDWQLFAADSFRRQLAEALERLVAALAAQRAFERAIVHARRWLALDLLHELAHRQLMLLYAWAGERAAALRQYRECVKVQEEELGVPPLAETSQLADAYAPFIEVLRAGLARPEVAARLAQLSEHWLSEGARLLPELLSAGPHPGLPPAPELGSRGEQARFFEGISQILGAVVGEGGVLFLDDLHWADEASLDLLTYLVRRSRRDRCMFSSPGGPSESRPTTDCGD